MYSSSAKEIDLPIYSERIEVKRSLQHLSKVIPTKENEQPTAQFNKLGIIFSLLYPLANVISTATAKFISGVPPMQSLFLRSLLTTPPFFAYLYYTNKADELKAGLRNPKLHLNIFFAILSGVTFYIALVKLSVSETFTIYSTLAITNGILGAIILKEPYSQLEKILGVISMIGVILIVRPPFIFGNMDDAIPNTNTSLSHSFAGILAFLSAATFSLYQISIRASRTNMDPYVISFCTNSLGIFWYGLYFVFYEYKSLTFGEYFGCFMFGVCYIACIILIGYALKYTSVSVFGLLGYTQLIFSLLVDLLIFADFPPFLTIVGALLIVGSSVYLIMKQKQA